MNNNYQKMWDGWAVKKSASYLDYKFNPNHRVGLTNYLREKELLKIINPQKEDVVLDAGCASGRQLFKIASKINKGCGVDIAPDFIRRANFYKEEENINNLFFQQSILEELSFEDSFFNKVICCEVLEHVDDKDRVLKELLRVLKKGGSLIITVPNMNANGTLWGRFLLFLKIRKFIPLSDFSEEGILKNGDANVRQFNKTTLVDWLKNNDLSKIYIKSVSFIDGPMFDDLLFAPLHVGVIRSLIVKFEQLLTNNNLFFGRHLIIKLIKN